MRTNPWTRIVWRRQGAGAHLFAAGLGVKTSINLAQQLAEGRVDGHAIQDDSGPDLDALVQLLNAGHLYLDQDR